MAKKTSKKKSGSKQQPAIKPMVPIVAVRANGKPRRLKQPKYASFKISKRIKHPVRLPSAWKLTKSAFKLFAKHKWLFLGVTAIYAIMNMILVTGLINTFDVSGLKSQLEAIFSGHLRVLESSLTIFVVLVGSTGSGVNGAARPYQIILTLIVSLAVIWALRQIFAGTKKIRVRDTYYRGMYPLIPFLLILLIIGIQMIPAAVGWFMYSLVVKAGIAQIFLEKLLWFILGGALTLLSLYMITSSIFALYIVTLPDMTPMKALRSARELVRNRRIVVLRKILFLPIIVLIGAVVVMIPVILWATPFVIVIYFFLLMLAVPATHAYMYTLYRELLRE
jgi:hypothetical protein